MPGTPESPPEVPSPARRRPISWLSRKTGWADSETRVRLSAVSVAVVLCGFVIFTLERGPAQNVEAVTAQVKRQVTAEVGPEVERIVIAATTQGTDLVSSAEYRLSDFGTPAVILHLKIPKIPPNCLDSPLMIWLKQPNSTVIASWRPRVLPLFPSVSLPVHKLPSGAYDLDVQACGGSFPPSEGRTVLRIP